MYPIALSSRANGCCTCSQTPRRSGGDPCGPRRRLGNVQEGKSAVDFGDNSAEVRRLISAESAILLTFSIGNSAEEGANPADPLAPACGYPAIHGWPHGLRTCRETCPAPIYGRVVQCSPLRDRGADRDRTKLSDGLAKREAPSVDRPRLAVSRAALGVSVVGVSAWARAQ